MTGPAATPPGRDSGLRHRPGGPGPSRRSVLAALATAAAAPAAAGPSLPAAPLPSADPRLLDDASQLNPTRVARHARLELSGDDTMLEPLRRLLAEAAAADQPVAVGGARHSMGGQSLCAGSSALTVTGRVLDADVGRRRYLVSAGARWRAVVPALDRLGLSVAVMQSNSDFSVGGTLSVNGHGWAAPYGAVAATVRRFRMLLADGTLVACSADENPDLFRAALGGYGLLGLLIDVELEAVPNVALRPALRVMEASSVGLAMAEAVRQEDLRMTYGRLSVAPGSFLAEALLATFVETGPPTGRVDADEGYLYRLAARTLLRAQAGSAEGKAARRWAETSLAPRFAPTSVNRNRLLAQPVAALGHPALGRTDILHEYFLPPDRLADFLAACRRTIPGSGQDLLNVTLRYVAADRVSLLAFAPGPRIAAVLLFDQGRTAQEDASMRRLTEALIEAALALGGSFYMPYRLHARPEQVRRAYPGLEGLLTLKRRHDPGGRFRNMLLDAYLA